MLLLLLLLPVKLQAKNTWMVMNIYGNVHLLSHLNEMSTMVLVIHLWGGGGGYFRNFFVGMCRWDPGTLSLIPELDQLNFATLY